MLQVAKNCPHLKTIISMDPLSEQQKTDAKNLGVRLLFIKDVENDVSLHL